MKNLNIGNFKPISNYKFPNSKVLLIKSQIKESNKRDIIELTSKIISKKGNNINIQEILNKIK